MKKWWIVIGSAAVLLMALGVAAYLFHKQTYEKVEIVKTNEASASDNSSYSAFAKGFLKYSRDGVALFDDKGDEVWNQSYQMQNPMIEKYQNTAVFADKGGTSVMVVTRDGKKGEFKTSRPIERVTVSKQGIVGAVLKDETTPRIICYDSNGEILVEQKASLSNTGYPIDISISEDGKTLVVAYLCIDKTTVSTKVSYYNFDEGVTKHEVATELYSDMMIPTVCFMNESDSVLIGDSAIVFWKGTKTPKEQVRVSFQQEIKSVATDEEKVAVVLKDKEHSKYELKVYNTDGKEVTSANFEGEYGNIKMTGKDVILHEGKNCLIVNASGIIKYEGMLDMAFQEIYKPGIGSQYVIINSDGMQKIQMKK